MPHQQVFVRRISLDLGRIIVDRPIGAPLSDYVNHPPVPGAKEGLIELAKMLGGKHKIIFLKGLRKDDPNPLRMKLEASLWLMFNLPEFSSDNYTFAFREEKWTACKQFRVNCHVDDRLGVFAAFPWDRPVLKILFDPDPDEIFENSDEIIKKIIFTDEEIERFSPFIWRKIILVTREEGWSRILHIIRRFRAVEVQRRVTA